MLTVRLPASLRHGSQTMEIPEPIGSLKELIAAVDRRLPGFARGVDEAMFNFAVNDELILQGINTHPLKDGDRVEIVPTISGGAHARRTPHVARRTARSTSHPARCT